MAEKKNIPYAALYFVLDIRCSSKTVLKCQIQIILQSQLEYHLTLETYVVSYRNVVKLNWAHKMTISEESHTYHKTSTIRSWQQIALASCID